MKRRLGLAFVCFSITAALSGASASAAEFTSGTHGSFNLVGTTLEPLKLTTDPGTISCKQVSFTGSASGTSQSALTLTPSYSECTLSTIFGNISVTATFNGCDFLITASESFHLSCPAGKAFVVSGPGCTVTYGAQSGPAEVHGTLLSIPFDSDITFKGKTKYSYSGFTCGSGSNTENGDHALKITVRGFNPDGTTVNVGHRK
jgi:hypothetical protein